jgi:hypothetical protein
MLALSVDAREHKGKMSPLCTARQDIRGLQFSASGLLICVDVTPGQV